MASDSSVDPTQASLAEEHKLKGNDFFKNEKYLEAIQEYMQAIELNPSVAPYYTNAAAAFANIEEHERAMEMAHKAIELNPSFTKAYYRRGTSLMALGEYKRAYKDFSLVFQAAPDDLNVKKKMQECEKLNMQKNFALALRVNEFDLDEKAIEGLEIPPSYSGPRLSHFDRVPAAFIPELVEWFKLEQKVASKVAYMIMNAARKLFQSQPNLVRIPVPEGVKITVCGDVHGQFFDLIQIFELNGYPSEQHYYLFNGDFVDRGAYSVEVILTMLAMKAAYPKFFFMARGNHESEHVNRLHGFMEETKRKYDEKMFSMMNKVFNALPIAHVIQEKLFVVHGGLPAKEDFMLADIGTIDRFKDPPNGTMFSQLLWSDPKQTDGFSPSHRGEGILWGPDVTRAFLDRNNLKMIIRSHVWEPTGYKVDHDGLCITIFSAPNYTGATSPAALMNIDATLTIEYRQFTAAGYQGKAMKPRPSGLPSFLMAGQGQTVMSGGATEWEDLLIQHGILKAPQNPKEQEPEVVYVINDTKNSASDLDGLSDDEEFIKTYRQQRLKELRGQKSANFSGQVTEISRPDFVTEVSEASKSHFVLVHLYQSGLAACQLVSRALRDLCGEYPQVKFVEIASTRCIENYPDRLLPTILIYQDTNVYTQVTNATPDKVKRLLDTIQEHLNSSD